MSELKIVALSLSTGSDYDAQSYASTTVDRFFSVASTLSSGNLLGWQVDTKTRSSFAFFREGSATETEDVGWVFQKCATVLPEGETGSESLFSEARKVYLLSVADAKGKRGETRNDLGEMLSASGAVIRIVAKSPSGCDGILLSLPQPISVRLRAFLSLRYPGIEIRETDGAGDIGCEASEGSEFVRSFMVDMLSYLFWKLPELYEAEDEYEFAEMDPDDEYDMEEEDAPEEAQTVDNTSIEVLELSIRSYNCLRRAGILTIGQLRTKSEEELSRVRNLGRKSVEEIKDRLASYLESHPGCVSTLAPSKTSYVDQLGKLIGLEEAKEQIRRIAAFARMQKDLRACGKQKIPVALHTEFVGNPGTAKTTVARILAGILNEIGLLSTNEMIEAGRSDLVARYEGQTCDKVKSLFSQARGKLLFIDEAYSLVEHWEGAYGDEAINVIVQEMENHRDETVVVFAGYPDKMQEFFQRNPGLRSRIPFTIHFADYTAQEMVQIVALEAGKRAFTISPEAEKKVQELCAQVVGQPEEGNGRFCRNLVEKAILAYATRVYGEDGDTGEKDFCLLPEDFPSPQTPEKEAKVIGFAA